MKRTIGILILAGVMLSPGVFVTIVSGSLIPALIVYGLTALLFGLVVLGVKLIS